MKHVSPVTIAFLLVTSAAIAQQPTGQQTPAQANLPQQQSQALQTTALQSQTQFSKQSAARQSQPDIVEQIIARVNNSIITQADLQRSKDAQQEESAKIPDPADRPKEQDLLRDLIDQQLLLQKANELGLSADTDVIKRLDQIRQQMHAESMEEMEKAAQAQGVSWEDFKQNLKNSILQQKVIQQEVGGHITITKQDIQKFYDEHKAEMERPEQVRLSEILVSTEKAPPVKTENGKTALPEAPDPQLVAAAQQKANAIYAQLQKGAKFADLAKSSSEGPTAQAGGDLEYFKRGTLAKQLEDKVFELQPGQYTEPIRTNQGWVILAVTEHTPAGIPPLKDVEPQIQERLYMTQMQPALRDYLTKLREDAYIDIKTPYVDTGASPNETKPVYTTAEANNTKAAPKKKKKLGLF
jgi:peptidyl-prolyl cis-trans isomerase SurA